MGLGKWIGFFALVASLYILWKIRTIVLLFFTAVILAIALNRLVRRLQQSGAKRGVAIALAAAILVTASAVLLTLIVTRLSNQFQELSELVPLGIEQLRLWSNWLQARLPGQIVDNLPSIDDLTQEIKTLFRWTSSHIYLWFSNYLSLILNTLLITILTIMLLVNPMPYRHAIISLFPAFYRQRADEILSKCEEGLMGWLAGVALSMSFIGITSIIGLLVLQVPLPFVNGLLAFILALIPYMGAILSVIPPLLLALLDSPSKAGAVLLLYFLIQQIEGNLVTPIIMEKQVSLLPAYTLALVTAFGFFFGFLGLFLALPILIVIQIWVKEVLIKDILDRWQTPPSWKPSHSP
ncbi:MULTISPECIES: AI-2E family transporter [unclassified Microcoleus]|uniref:AI-2E family transporter n=1 Tax=unclassified Microcoleus TaxID=2642155 RepID=UPI002FD2DE04